MADVKISALPLASTPLAGTEVLPIVQSATTDQVSVANLTAGRAVSAASLTLTTTPLAVGSGGTGFSSITSGYVPYATAANTLGSSSGLQFDGNNLGVGVTPSAWSSAYKVIDVGSIGSVASAANVFGSFTNAYVNASSNYIYKNNNYATMYLQNAAGAGQHQWHIAPSGTAGNPITFTQAMTLDASGNLLVGTTTAPAGSGKLTVSDSAAETKLTITNTGTGGVQYWIGSTNNSSGAVGGGRLAFYDQTSNALRMCIDSSGNVGIGTTSPGSKVQINDPGTGLTFTNAASGNFNIGLLGGVGIAEAYIFQRANAALIFGTNNTERARIDSSGNLLVGTTSVNYSGANFTISADAGTTKWLVGPANAAASNFYVTAVSGSGVYLNGTSATSWSSNSDERIKENLNPIENALDRIVTLRTVTGNLINDKNKTPHAFLIAQDVLKVLPEAVDVTNPNMYGVAYTETIPLAIAAIKELAAKVSALEAKI